MASMGDMADSWFASMSSPSVAPVCRGSHAEAWLSEPSRLFEAF